MAKLDVRSMTMEEMQLFLADLGEPKFRAKQVFDWIHNKQVSSFEEMTNLSKGLREKLKEKASLGGMDIVKCLVSQVDGTRKYLFALGNDSIIESVMMKHDYGNTVCISTQVGCRMGCKFCASTLDGVERNLSASEMLGQVYAIQKESGEHIHGVVLMGSGEPLDNYNSVLRFIHLVNHPDGQNMGQRHITLSTCGLIEKMNQLAQERLQITLAVSLHAPNDEIRRLTMPVAKANPMDRLLQACSHYAEVTKRRITFEYALIRGVNDSEECATELAKKLKGILCHVNLIPMNEVREREYEKSTPERVQKFAALLQAGGVETTIRKKLGIDIDAACGQLRRGYLQR